MVQLLSSIVDIRTSCYAARLAAFSSPQKHCKALIFRGALKQLSRSLSYRSEITALDSITRLLISSLEDDKRRLDETLARLLSTCEIIPLSKEVVMNAMSYRELFGFGYQDSLIYSSVMHHLERGIDVARCFLNRNSKDFDDPDIIEMLESKNCKLLFNFDKGRDYVRGLLGI